MAEDTKTTPPKSNMPTMADIVKISMLRQMEDYIHNKVRAHIARSHENMLRTKSKKTLVKEEEPTNVMGSSSTSQGPIQGFDPLLFIKAARRKKIKPI